MNLVVHNSYFETKVLLYCRLCFIIAWMLGFISGLCILNSSQAQTRLTPKYMYNASLNLDMIHVELLHIGPGRHWSSAFGDLAFRIKRNQQDEVYMLAQPYLALPSMWYFFLGKSRYHGEVRSFTSMQRLWANEHRQVISYALQLSPRQLRQIYYIVNEKVQSERQVYYYDLFHTQAVLQIRDILDQVLQHKIYDRSKEFIHIKDSRRKHIRKAYANFPVLLFLSEWLGSAQLDQKQSLWNLSYHPHLLIKLLQQIKISNTRLLGKQKALQAGRSFPLNNPNYPNNILLWFITLVSILYAVSQWLFYIPSFYQLIYLTIWALISTSIALLAFQLSAYSLVNEVRSNWALLCCCPFDLILCLGWKFDHKPIRKYLISFLILRISILITLILLTKFLLVNAINWTILFMTLSILFCCLCCILRLNPLQRSADFVPST
jgi:hypothetical protein